MAFLIGGANSAADAGYDIDNSCRFETDTYMTKSISSGNTRTFTLSFWVKRTTVSSGLYGYLASFYQDSNNRISIGFYNDDAFFVYAEDGGVARVYLKTDRLFRDPAAWYHIAIAIDTTQGTDTNRAKLYVNGVQETSFSAATYPDEDQELILNTNFYVGTYNASSNWFYGYMAEYVYIDGTALAPSSFGETDEDSGIWKPIKVSGLTFGTNGFYLDFEASDNLGNDAKGGTDLTETNLVATDQTTDTPTNNFATMNPLAISSYASLGEGNTYVIGNTSSDNGNADCTFAPTKGKWYIESKAINASDTSYPRLGAAPARLLGRLQNANPGIAGQLTPSFNYQSDGNKSLNGAQTSHGDVWEDDDIISVKLDLDNQAVYYAINDIIQNSGTALATGSTYFGTGENTMLNVAVYNGINLYMNFGNPAYAISSSNADANGYGNFEYEVPSGYYALCTKNLAEFG